MTRLTPETRLDAAPGARHSVGVEPLDLRVGAVDPTGGYREPEAWVWCGSVIRGDDDRYHMFASVWSKSLPFNPYWVSNSRVVRATADRPEGPYRYVEDVLPPRGEAFWDGRMTHNPTIHYADGHYLLFYTGTTYPGPAPDADWQPGWDHPTLIAAHANQRIGLATATSISGPWTRRDAPILAPRPDRWDGLITTNPAPCVLPDGRIRLLYKSVAERGGAMRFGLAAAVRWDAPFHRVQDRPVLEGDADGGIEDGYLWCDDRQFHLLFKDFTGRITGEIGAPALIGSRDAIHWDTTRARRVCSKTLPTLDGRTLRLSALERAQVLFEPGPMPSHLFFAAAEGGTHDTFVGAAETFNLCLPVQR